MMTDSNILCSNGTIREIFCLILLLSVMCLTSTFLHMSDFILPTSVRFSKEAESYQSDDLLVEWRPSYNDSNVYYLQEQDRESEGILIFNPTSFTGADFYARLMKGHIIRNGNTYVKIFNLTGVDAKSKPLEHQTRLLKEILLDPWQSTSYVISDAHVSDAHVSDIFGSLHYTFRLTSPFSVSFIRHPFDAFVASFYYHRHGQMLFSSINETREQFLSKLTKAVGEVEKYVESGKEFRTYANEMSAVVPFCGWNSSKCSGVHPGRAARVITRAHQNVKDGNTFIGLMEDFRAIPSLLERLSPVILKGLSQYAEKQKADFPHWLDTKINLTPRVREKLEKDKRLKLELRFYQWVKERYYNEKKRLVNPER